MCTLIQCSAGPQSDTKASCMGESYFKYCMCWEIMFLFVAILLLQLCYESNNYVLT